MITIQYKKLNSINIIINLIKAVEMDIAKRDSSGQVYKGCPKTTIADSSFILQTPYIPLVKMIFEIFAVTVMLLGFFGLYLSEIWYQDGLNNLYLSRRRCEIAIQEHMTAETQTRHSSIVNRNND
jgi:hypothetical protein